MVVTILAALLFAAAMWIRSLHRLVEERSTRLSSEIRERERAERDRSLAEERSRIARDLHDELGVGLTEIGLQGDLATDPETRDDDRGQFVSNMSRRSRSLVASLDEIVWAVNPAHDHPMALGEYFSQFAHELLPQAGIRCRQNIAQEWPSVTLGSEQRHELFVAFKEALNNVVKHSGATEVRLEIKLADGRLIVRIEDNGRGFAAPAGEISHNGLHNMNQRLSRIGGECQIQSEPGKGTTVTFHLPIPS